MAHQQQTAPGGHYSGHNPIPTVKQFVENLDRDKKQRDKEIDERSKAANAKTGPSAPTTAAGTTSSTSKKPAQDGVGDHTAQSKTIEGTEKTVTDPTTGREVVIADVNEDMIEEVENPHLIVPNANLNKSTVSLVLGLCSAPYVLLTQTAHQDRSLTIPCRLQGSTRRDRPSGPGC